MNCTIIPRELMFDPSVPGCFRPLTKQEKQKRNLPPEPPVDIFRNDPQFYEKILILKMQTNCLANMIPGTRSWYVSVKSMNHNGNYEKYSIARQLDLTITGRKATEAFSPSERLSFGSIGPVTTIIFRSVIAKYCTNASKSFQIPRLMAALCGLILLMKKCQPQEQGVRDRNPTGGNPGVWKN